jgi:hypothetical protein
VEQDVLVNRWNFSGCYGETDADYHGELLGNFCNQAEKVIELLNASCEMLDLTSLILPASTLEASCHQLGLESMALTLGQIGRAVHDRNSRAIRWLLASLSQEYVTLSLTVEELQAAPSSPSARDVMSSSAHSNSLVVGR